MIFYKDTNNELYAFENNTTQDIIERVENIHNTKLFKITKDEYIQLKQPSLAKLKQTKIKQVEKLYKQKTQEPINYKNTTFQADDKSQDVLTKVITTAPTQIDWLDISNNFVTLTLDELKELANLILVRNQELFKKKVELKQTIDNVNSIDELNQIGIEF